MNYGLANFYINYDRLCDTIAFHAQSKVLWCHLFYSNQKTVLFINEAIASL